MHLRFALLVDPVTLFVTSADLRSSTAVTSIVPLVFGKLCKNMVFFSLVSGSSEMLPLEAIFCRMMKACLLLSRTETEHDDAHALVRHFMILATVESF